MRDIPTGKEEFRAKATRSDVKITIDWDLFAKLLGPSGNGCFWIGAKDKSSRLHGVVKLERIRGESK